MCINLLHMNMHPYVCIQIRIYGHASIFFWKKIDGYCSTVQGLLDWFEVDLGFSWAFIYSNRFVCSVCMYTNTHLWTYMYVKYVCRCASIYCIWICIHMYVYKYASVDMHLFKHTPAALWKSVLLVFGGVPIEVLLLLPSFSKAHVCLYYL